MGRGPSQNQGTLRRGLHSLSPRDDAASAAPPCYGRRRTGIRSEGKGAEFPVNICPMHSLRGLPASPLCFFPSYSPVPLFSSFLVCLNFQKLFIPLRFFHQLGSSPSLVFIFVSFSFVSVVRSFVVRSSRVWLCSSCCCRSVRLPVLCVGPLSVSVRVLSFGICLIFFFSNFFG